MINTITSGTCSTCKHYRMVEMRSPEGEIVTDGYCHASSHFVFRKPTQTCKRWAAVPESIEYGRK